MRILNKFSSYAAVAGLALMTLASCSDDIKYTTSEYPGAQDAYFPIQGTEIGLIEAGQTDYIVNIYRPSTDAPSTVALEWSGETDAFTLPSTAVFGQDDVISQIVIEFDNTALEVSYAYELNVKIVGGEDTPYTQSSLDIELTYSPMSDWKPFGTTDGLGTYTFTQYYNGTEYPVRVLYRYNTENNDLIELTFNWLIDNDDPSQGFETFLMATSEDGGKTINVPEQPYAENANYGTVYVMEAGDYNPAASSGGSYYDAETGTFYLDVIYFIDGGYFGYGYEFFQFNGFEDTSDYSVQLSDLGSIVAGGTTYQVINFSWDAAALVKYAAVSTASLSQGGEVSSDLVENFVLGIDDKSVPSKIASNPGIYTVSFDAEGSYTLVAVSYKADATGTYSAEAYDWITFDYKFLTDENAGWKSLGYVLYTDGYMGSIWGFEEPTYYVELQENNSTPGYYRLVNPYGADYPYNDFGDWDYNVNSYLYIHAENPECVYIAQSPQTMDWGYGEYTFYSLAGYLVDAGYSETDVIEEEANGTLADGKITFPEGTLLYAEGEEGWFVTNLNDIYNQEGQLVVGDLGLFELDLNSLTKNPNTVAQTNAKVKAKLAAKAKTAKASKAGKAKKVKTVKARHAAPVNFGAKAVKTGSRQALNLVPHTATSLKKIK